MNCLANTEFHLLVIPAQAGNQPELTQILRRLAFACVPLAAPVLLAEKHWHSQWHTSIDL